MHHFDLLHDKIRLAKSFPSGTWRVIWSLIYSKEDGSRGVKVVAGSDEWSCTGAAGIYAVDPDGRSVINGLANITLV